MTTLTLPAHSLLTGDRVCIGGHWHLVGRVTVENQLPEGAIVHVVLDHGSSDADLDADATFDVQRLTTLGEFSYTALLDAAGIATDTGSVTE